MLFSKNVVSFIIDRKSYFSISFGGDRMCLFSYWIKTSNYKNLFGIWIKFFFSPQTFEANLNPSFFFFPFTKTFYENQKSCVILVSGGSVRFLVNWCEACWSFYQRTLVLVVCVFLTISLMRLGSWFLVTFEAIFCS